MQFGRNMEWQFNKNVMVEQHTRTLNLQRDKLERLPYENEDHPVQHSPQAVRLYHLVQFVMHEAIIVPIIPDAYFFNKTVLISVSCPVLCLLVNVCNALFFTSLYFKCYPNQPLTQNSTISLNLRVSGERV